MKCKLVVVVTILSFLMAGCMTNKINNIHDEIYRSCSKELKFNGFNVSDLDIRKHLWEVGGAGEITKRNLELPPGKDSNNPEEGSSEQFRIIMDNLNALNQKLSASNSNKKLKLLLTFNGGLNSQKAIRKSAEQIVPCMIADGYYPIFMSWPTGAIDSYLHQASLIRSGRSETSEDPNPIFSTSAYIISDVLKSVGGAPNAWSAMGLRYYDSKWSKDRKALYTVNNDLDMCSNIKSKDDKDFDLQKKCIEKGIRKPEFNAVLGEDDSSRNQFGLNSIRRFAQLPFRIVSAPFVQGIGKSAWQNFKRRSRTTLHRSFEFNPNLYKEIAESANEFCFNDQDQLIGYNPGVQEGISDYCEKLRQFKRYPNGIGGFSRFFTHLEECYQDATNNESEQNISLCPVDFNLSEYPITLIGHSMGSIVINQILELYPNLHYKNIVYMAAAATTRDTLGPLSSQLVKIKCGTSDNSKNQAGSSCSKFDTPKFYSLMLHPRNDVYEYSGFGFAPFGSLLAWIDEFYEEPSTEVDRTFGRWDNIRATKHLFPKDIQKNMIFRVFNENLSENRIDNPLEHGEFNDLRMRYWCPEFWLGQHISSLDENAEDLCPGKKFQEIIEKKRLTL